MRYTTCPLHAITKLALGAAVALGTLATLAPGAHAQQTTVTTTEPVGQQTSVQFGVFGGPTFPVGPANNGINTGWTGGALLDFTSPQLPVGLRVDGSYQQLAPSRSGTNGSVKIWGGDLDLLFTPAGHAVLKPYLETGLGVYDVINHVRGEVTLIPPRSHTNLAVNGGTGLRYSANGFSAFLEGRYLHIFTGGHNTQLIPVVFGIAFGTY